MFVFDMFVVVTDELPYIDFPLHTVIKLTPLAYGCVEERVHFGIDAVSTHIPRPHVRYFYFRTKLLSLQLSLVSLGQFLTFICVIITITTVLVYQCNLRLSI